ncbi:hypothetical protein V6N12_030906 [Hibiscus sabdariffa]|uniref:Uncharacterized protein n=1 Tax=Hibiscus sabdariffa TaxID=183260 RepID=A0ABR2E7C6_9ROSI
MDCDVLTVTRPIVSCKDMVTAFTQTSHTALDYDDDIELLEEDVADGIPTIDFSKQVKLLAIKSMNLTLVLKVLGRRVGYNTLQNSYVYHMETFSSYQANGY